MASDRVTEVSNDKGDTPTTYTMYKENNASSENYVKPVNGSDFDEKLVSEPVNEYGIPDKFKTSKSLVLRKTEILSEQYSAWYWRVVLLFSAFLCGYGYGLDGNLRYVYTTYATNSYSTHSLLSTIGVVNSVIAAASQIIYARLSDVFGRLTLFITAIVFYVVGTIIESQASLRCSKVCCRCRFLQRWIRRDYSSCSFDPIGFLFSKMEIILFICSSLAIYHQHLDFR